jgi:hypothetical protein
MAKSHKPRELAPLTVEAAEAVLADLRAKHSKLTEFAAKLAEERKALAFKAHGIDDVNASHRLEKVVAATLQNAEVLASLMDAIAEAETRLMLAKALRDDVAAQAKAGQILELAAELRQCGVEMGAAAQTIEQHSRRLVGLLAQLKTLGIFSPTELQLDTLGFQCVSTLLMSTPWHRRFQHLAPGERRTFDALIGSWADNVEARIRRQQGEQKAEAA